MAVQGKNRAPTQTMSATESDDMLTRKEAAAYLATLGYRVSPDHLCNMASRNNAGNGPRFRRIGERVIRYRRGDLKAWLESRSTWVE